VQKDSVLIEKGQDRKETARRRASSTSVAGAARGLQGEEGSNEISESDYKALNEVEAVTHSEDEIREFIKEGKQQGE
ncbi:MAG: hypothetical protein HUJ29_11030, partial [Gammaproteobacteria bacterium]|nr:hypothetical protein [Gammaproteobacteria bacterium]